MSVGRLPAVHPGGVLSEDLMKRLGPRLNGLARDMRVPVTRLSQIVNGRRSITADDDVPRRAVWSILVVYSEEVRCFAHVKSLACHSLAVDFDRANWGEDAGAFLDTCRRLNFHAALERSRSGRGWHVTDRLLSVVEWVVLGLFIVESVVQFAVRPAAGWRHIHC